MTTLKAENLGPVQHIEAVVPDDDHGHIMVFHGLNGTGKTELLGAIDFRLTGAGNKPSVRSGCKTGSLDLAGGSLKLGANVRRIGSPDVKVVVGQANLSELIDNQFKDATVCDEHRIAALLSYRDAELSTATVTELFRKECGEAMEETTIYDCTPGESVVEYAERMRLLFQSDARGAEDDVVKWKTQADAAELAAQCVDLSAPDDAQQLQQALTAATQRRMRLDAERSAAETSRKKADAARKALATLGSDEDVDEFRTLAEAAAAQVREADRIVRDAEDALAEAREKLTSAKALRAVREEALQSAVERGAKRRNAEALISAVVEGPSDAEIADADASIAAARKAVELGALVRKAKEQAAAAVDFRSAERKAAADAEMFRKASDNVDKALSAAVAKLGGPIQVRGKRLVVHKQGVETYVGDLSAGERAALFLPMVVGAVGRGAHVILRQESWEGLDVLGKQAVWQAVHDSGVIVWTAQSEQDAANVGREIRVEEYRG